MFRKMYDAFGKQLFSQGSCYTPDPLDTMLVSYPKSGNTWVRALVANLISKSPSLTDMERLVPDVYKANERVIKNSHVFKSGGRLVKSHEPFNPSYKRVIYIIRDPRDVCVSYYHYQKKIKKLPPEIDTLDKFVDEYISGYADGYGTWGEHVDSWQSANEAKKLVLKYEDIAANTTGELEKIIEFIGITATQDQIKSAVHECHIDNLRDKEKKESGTWKELRRAEEQGSFFRSGGKQNWNEFSGNSIDKIQTKWERQMQFFGYLSSS